MRGERIGMLASPAACRAAAAVYLLAPQIPMLFQGEEWAASSPFPFFSDLDPAFAAALAENLQRYEDAYGPVRRASTPQTPPFSA